MPAYALVLVVVILQARQVIRTKISIKVIHTNISHTRHTAKVIITPALEPG